MRRRYFVLFVILSLFACVLIKLHVLDISFGQAWEKAKYKLGLVEENTGISTVYDKEMAQFKSYVAERSLEESKRAIHWLEDLKVSANCKTHISSFIDITLPSIPNKESLILALEELKVEVEECEGD